LKYEEALESIDQEQVEPENQPPTEEENPPVVAEVGEDQPSEEPTPGMGEADELRDRYLRLAAEYENFRKRTARERTESWNRAQADIVGKMLGGLDDLQRVSDLDPNSATSKDVIDGVELVERKFFKELEMAGLEKIGEVGNRFDPNEHEAVGMLPAESEEEDQTVGSVFQAGYRLGNSLIRPATVQVRVWHGESTPENE
jgi:molecular chaperone GrpE